MEKLNEIEGALRTVREIVPDLKRAEDEASVARSRQTEQVTKLTMAVRELAKAVAAGVNQLPYDYQVEFASELTAQLKSE